MQSLRYRLSSLALMAGLTIMSPAVNAKDKTPKGAPAETKDDIQVVGHIPLTGGPVSHFFTTPHYSSYYLYAERDGGQGVALIDVTNAGRPALLGEVAYNSAGFSSLSVVAGTAALMTVASADPADPPPATIRVMDFSDPRNTKVSREFTGVTAMSRDERRGLIFIANGEGIWILQQHLAVDPQLEKYYANYVLYSH
jgi:hypothetical protein